MSSTGGARIFVALEPHQKNTVGGGVVWENPGNRKKSDFLATGTVAEIRGDPEFFEVFEGPDEKFSRFLKVFEDFQGSRAGRQPKSFAFSLDFIDFIDFY